MPSNLCSISPTIHSTKCSNLWESYPHNPELKNHSLCLQKRKPPKCQPLKKKHKEPFEQLLFKAADKLRKNIDAAEYKHLVLGLIFLKYISDAFVHHREKLQTGKIDYFKPKIYNLEDRDYYTGEGGFWVPSKARWEIIHAHSKKPTIGKTLDRAMETIEKENGPLRGILPKIYAKENLD